MTCGLLNILEDLTTKKGPRIFETTDKVKTLPFLCGTNVQMWKKQMDSAKIIASQQQKGAVN